MLTHIEVARPEFAPSLCAWSVRPLALNAMRDVSQLLYLVNEALEMIAGRRAVLDAGAFSAQLAIAADALAVLHDAAQAPAGNACEPASAPTESLGR